MFEHTGGFVFRGYLGVTDLPTDMLRGTSWSLDNCSTLRATAGPIRNTKDISLCFKLTWHLIGGVRSLSGLRRGEAGAVAKACLQRRLTLRQTALCLNAWQHHTEVWIKKKTKKKQKNYSSVFAYTDTSYQQTAPLRARTCSEFVWNYTAGGTFKREGPGRKELIKYCRTRSPHPPPPT